MAPKPPSTPGNGAAPGVPPRAVSQAPPPTPLQPPPGDPPPGMAVAAPQQSRPVAPPKKKKPPPKMPGAKKDFPQRLLDQMRDYTLIGLILGGIALFGRYLESQAHGGAHGDEHGHGDHHDEHHHRALAQRAASAAADALVRSSGTLVEAVAGAHGRELSGHHHYPPELDMKVTLGICVMLITVTIVFEMVKHKLEHDCPPMLQQILQAMFGELTVLGFIALVTYMLIKFEVIANVSAMIYDGDKEHMLHLFEDIHFMLFFVMIIFLLEAVILLLLEHVGLYETVVVQSRSKNVPLHQTEWCASDTLRLSIQLPFFAPRQAHAERELA